MKKKLLISILSLFTVGMLSAQTAKKVTGKKAPVAVKTISKSASSQPAAASEEEKKIADRKRSLQNRKVVTTPASESLVPGN